jgi:hypothetical protein
MAQEQIKNLIAKVDFKDAQILADLGAIIQDLDAIMNSCSRLLTELLKENSQDHLLIESLWTTALIRYARCFKDSKRFGLSESIFHGLPGDPIGVHQLYINLRDKHIAHSVNPFEQMEVGVILTPTESTERQIIGVATLAMRHICSDFDGVRQLGMLANVIKGKVSQLAKQYEQRVLEQSKLLPIDDLYKQASPRLIAPGPESAGRTR